MKNNFENSIKNKVEQFDGMPPEKLWTGISQKIKNNKMENNNSSNYSKLWLGITAVVVIILMAVLWQFNTNEQKGPPLLTPAPIAQQVTSGGKGETANDLFPTELEIAKKSGKGIMAYVCMENCKFCTKFVNETLSKPEVHEYLEDRFIQVAVDLRNKENKHFFKKHGINAAPSALFFAADGSYLNEVKGACPTEQFLEVVDNAWEMMKNGSYKSGTTIVPDAKIFPNPNNGHFNIQLNAAKKPITVKVINENGQEVFSEKQNNFSGFYEGKINLKNPQKGIYYLKIIQAGQVSTQQIIVQ